MNGDLHMKRCGDLTGHQRKVNSNSMRFPQLKSENNKPPAADTPQLTLSSAGENAQQTGPCSADGSANGLNGSGNLPAKPTAAQQARLRAPYPPRGANVTQTRVRGWG